MLFVRLITINNDEAKFLEAVERSAKEVIIAQHRSLVVISAQCSL